MVGLKEVVTRFCQMRVSISKLYDERRRAK
jgi:hypothetical protein